MLVLNRSLMNQEYNLINVLKALVATVSMCSPQVVFLSKITPRHFTLITRGMFGPFNVRKAFWGLDCQSCLSYTPRNGPYRKHRFPLTEKLLLSDGMTYFIVVYSAIDTHWAEVIIPLSPFTGRCLVTSECCDSKIVALSVHVTKLCVELPDFTSYGIRSLVTYLLTTNEVSKAYLFSTHFTTH
jgi:hypothetical protein